MDLVLRVTELAFVLMQHFPIDGFWASSPHDSNLYLSNAHKLIGYLRTGYPEIYCIVSIVSIANMAISLNLNKSTQKKNVNQFNHPIVISS